MMNEFKNYHPLVNFSYFAAVIGFSMFLLHPACLLASFSGSLSYALALKGRKALRNNLLYMLPMVIMAALINPAFNHEGVTILAYFPNGNPLTSESIAYGIAAAVMLVSVLNWFSCYNEIMTTDKFIYLFGRIMPSLSLVLAMTFRFGAEIFGAVKRSSHRSAYTGAGYSKRQCFNENEKRADDLIGDDKLGLGKRRRYCRQHESPRLRSA